MDTTTKVQMYLVYWYNDSLWKVNSFELTSDGSKCRNRWTSTAAKINDAQKAELRS